MKSGAAAAAQRRRKRGKDRDKQLASIYPYYMRSTTETKPNHPLPSTPLHTHAQRKHLSQTAIRSWLLKAVARYFDSTVIIENHDDLKEARPSK